MLEEIHSIYKPILKKEIVGPIFIIIGALILYYLVTRLTKKLFRLKINKIDDRKNKTIVSLINNTCKYLILFIAAIMILEIYGISTKGFITSLGVVGVVAGLAIQDILKDILSGASIIVENQYAIGDTVTIGDFKGEVLSLGLRTTRLKSYTGEIKIIANRNITEVINHSMEKSLAIVDIPVSYDEDVEHVENVLNTLCETLKKENKLITGNITCLGMTSFDDSSINFRITAEVKSMQQYAVERFILKRVKITFDEENITIPYNQVVIHSA
jgi:small conductance mechanosensitive channel